MLQENGGELSDIAQIGRLIPSYTDFTEDDMNYSEITSKGNKYRPYWFGRNFALKNLQIAGYLTYSRNEPVKLTPELAAIDHEIDLHNITFEQISANLDMVLDIVESCGEAYRNASDTVKKLMNQAIFEKFYISNGPEDEFGVKLTFKAPYDQILDPIKEDLSQINTALKRKPEAVDGLADKAKGHIHDFFGCGPNLGQNKNPYSNESDFFNPNSSSKDLLAGNPLFDTL